MFDRIFAPALAFLMLLATTVTVATGFFPGTRSGTTLAATDTPASITLEPVLIHIKRSDALRQLQEEDARPRSSAPGRAAEGRGVMLHPVRD